MGGVGGHRDAHRRGVAGTEKVTTAVEPAIEFRAGGRTLTGELVHFRPDAAAQLNLDAKQAVLDGVALAYRMRGSEDAASETVGSFGHGLRQAFEQLPS